MKDALAAKMDKVEAKKRAAKKGNGAASAKKGNGAAAARTTMDGAALLSAVHRFVGRFLAYPSTHTHIAHALWIAHCHAMDAWNSTPRLAFLSPEPASGKSRGLEVTALVVPRPVPSCNCTPAYLFRRVGAPEGRPTILYDEVDTVFGKQVKDGNEEIRGLLNAGHRKGATVGRCVVHGKVVSTEDIPAYAAVALAGLGDLPRTLMTRSVVVRMKRRAPTEKVEPFRDRDHEAEGQALCEHLAQWAGAHEAKWATTRPAMPAEIVDRDADVWEPLFAVADSAGGEWPALARAAAVALVAEAKTHDPSLGIRLLSDLRAVFDADHAKTGLSMMFTLDILTELHTIDDAPWDSLRGRALDARGLAWRLRQFGIHRKQIRIGKGTGKGYVREDFHDAWSRYLSAADEPPLAAEPEKAKAKPKAKPQPEPEPTTKSHKVQF